MIPPLRRVRDGVMVAEIRTTMKALPVFEVLEIPYGGEAYEEQVRLRDLHLRQPIGLRLRAEDRVGEEEQRHFVLWDGEEMVGGVIAIRWGEGEVKFRQMWVHPDLRGLGQGKFLLDGAEKVLVSEGVRAFFLHARENAAGFYERCGYRRVGGEIIEVGRPHVRMEKGWG